jgi:hypothetical protein
MGMMRSVDNYRLPTRVGFFRKGELICSPFSRLTRTGQTHGDLPLRVGI